MRPSLLFLSFLGFLVGQDFDKAQDAGDDEIDAKDQRGIFLEVGDEVEQEAEGHGNRAKRDFDDADHFVLADREDDDAIAEEQDAKDDEEQGNQEVERQGRQEAHDAKGDEEGCRHARAKDKGMGGDVAFDQ